MSKKESSSESERTDGGYGWVVVVSAFFIGFITDGLVFSFGILLVELLDQFHKGRAATATIASVMTGVMHLVGPLVGALCDRFGCRVVVVTGAVISCAGFVISTFATSVFYLCLSYGVLAGLGFGLMYIPAGVCVIQHFNKRRALANGIAVCGSGVGTFVFNQLTRKLIDEYGWRGALMLEAGITLQGAVLGLFLLPPKPTNKADYEIPLCSEKCIEQKISDRDTFTEIKDSSKDSFANSQREGFLFEKDAMEVDIKSCQLTDNGEELIRTQPTERAAEMKTKLNALFNVDLLKDFRCWVFLMSAFTFQLAFTIPFNLLPDQAIEIGMTKYQASWLTSSIGISNTVSRICIGWIGDLKWVNRLVMLEVILFLAGLSTGLSIFLTSFELKMFYTCLYGFLVGGYVTLCTVVLADLFGADIIAKSFGLLMFFIGVSGFISTPIGGILFDFTGKYDVTFIVAGAEFMVAGFLLFLLKLFSK